VFVHDVCIRRKWIIRKKRPIVTITCSRHKTIIFGALSSDDGKQLFRPYDRFDSNSFIEYFEEVRKKFKKFVIFVVDRAQHNTDLK
jgi:hypothetical protein